MVFVAIGAVGTLFYMVMTLKDESIKKEGIRADKAERKVDKTDSINHELYQILGAKKVIDELKNPEQKK